MSPKLLHSFPYEGASTRTPGQHRALIGSDLRVRTASFMVIGSAGNTRT